MPFFVNAVIKLKLYWRHNLRQHVTGELHPHEHPAAAEADDHRGEAHELQQHSVELGSVGVVRLVQDNHPRPAEAEHEAAG